MLDAPERSAAVVIEMGARSIGHVATLCRIARPDVGVVTRVGAAHLELFGSIDSVVVAKGELVECLPATGFAVLNGDDALVMSMADRTDASVLTYGKHGDVRAEHLVVVGTLAADVGMAGVRVLQDVVALLGGAPDGIQ